MSTTKNISQHNPLVPQLFLTTQFCSLAYQSHLSMLTKARLRKWVLAALEQDAEITLRFVDSEEAQRLNALYRGKDYIPNVLTFSYNENSNIDKTITMYKQPIFADIVLCCEKIKEEALEQAKSLIAHYAHLIVHGVLHAQGYNHEEANDATIMESFEIKILNTLGFSSPYD